MTRRRDRLTRAEKFAGSQNFSPRVKTSRRPSRDLVVGGSDISDGVGLAVAGLGGRCRPLRCDVGPLGYKFAEPVLGLSAWCYAAGAGAGQVSSSATSSSTAATSAGALHSSVPMNTVAMSGTRPTGGI